MDNCERIAPWIREAAKEICQFVREYEDSALRSGKIGSPAKNGVAPISQIIAARVPPAGGWISVEHPPDSVREVILYTPVEQSGVYLLGYYHKNAWYGDDDQPCYPKLWQERPLPPASATPESQGKEQA